MFVHLHTHSIFSFCRGANSIEDLCSAVKKRGMDMLALTDTNSISGLIRFLQIAQQVGIRPIIGAEVVSNGLRAILLVKDREGYRNLYHILSQRHLNADFSLLKVLTQQCSGLFILTDSIPLLNLLKTDVPRENLFIELQPNPRQLALLRYSRATKIPLVATNGVYFLNRDDFFLHRILRAIDCNTTLSCLDERELASSDAWLKDPGQMARMFPACPEALENTKKIADQCLHDLDFRHHSSAPTSIVSCCRDISTIDPIAHNLLFERFLNLGRKNPPACDVDIAWDEWGNVHDHIFQKYGIEKNSMLVNCVRLSAVRKIAKAYGLPEAEINSMTKKLSNCWSTSPHHNSIDNYPGYRYHEFNYSWNEILSLAEKLLECPSNLSLHGGGVVITPNVMDYYVPHERVPICGLQSIQVYPADSSARTPASSKR